MRYIVRSSRLAQGIDLILHQSNQRGDDDSRPLHDERRELIA